MIDTAVRFFQEGGFFMFPIAVVLIIGLIVAIERYVYLSAQKLTNRRDFNRLHQMIAKRDLKGALNYTQESGSAMSTMIGFGDILSEEEILALAISSEEDDARIYRSYAEMLRADYPDTAKVFDGMAEEEDGHRKALIAAFRVRFGKVIPPRLADALQTVIPRKRTGFGHVTH